RCRPSASLPPEPRHAQGPAVDRRAGHRRAARREAPRRRPALRALHGPAQVGAGAARLQGRPAQERREDPGSDPDGLAGRGGGLMPAFEVTLPVRFGQVDYAGIMYYPRFFDNFHTVFEDMFTTRLGVPYMSILRDRRIGFPMVHMETDFRRP